MGKDKGLESLSDSSAEDITAYLIALQNKTLSYRTKPLILLTAERNQTRKLYEIDKDIDSFEWDIDPDTGEILNPDGLDALQMERDAKIEGVSLKIKNLTAELDAVKREKSNFDSRAKSLEKEIEGYKGFLTYALQGQKFSTPKVAVSFRKSESVLVKDEYLVPDKYCEFTMVRKPNKTNLKKALADMAGVKYDAHYSVASVDPPELVRFIKEYHPDVIFDIPHDKNGKPVSMWSLIPTKSMPPTRIVRYCCQYLKEQNGHGKGRLKVTGVRWAESVRRKKSHGEVTIMDKKAKRFIEKELGDLDYKVTQQGGVVLPLDGFDRNNKMVEMCYKTHTTTVNPIIDWTEGEVWEFLKEYNIPYCTLYDEGFKRLGCIGCPMGSKEQRIREFERWPKYKHLYMVAFERMIENRKREGGTASKREDAFKSAEQVMDGYVTESWKPHRGGGNRLYPYATTRVTKDFADMTPEEIVDWWID